VGGGGRTPPPPPPPRRDYFTPSTWEKESTATR
jgi:hypothetical protein